MSLSPAERRLIYRAHRLVGPMHARAFAVVIDKRSPKIVGDSGALAWETMLQRLERASAKENTPLLLVHDEGEDDRIRKAHRRARRYLTAGSMLGTGQITTKAELFVEDPVSRRSDRSYLIQFADLLAYAAFREVIPPSKRTGLVVPRGTWLELGAAINRAVNKHSGGVPGIVHRTR